MTNNIICGQNEKKIDRNLVFVHKFSWKSFIVNFLVVKVLNIWGGIISYKNNIFNQGMIGFGVCGTHKR